MSYTKGPWVFEDDMGPDIGVYKTYSGEDTFIPICSVHTPDIYNTSTAIAEEDANAHLIAAAPDLLEACKDILLTIDHRDGLRHRKDLITDDERDKLRNAIAKAEGRE